MNNTDRLNYIKAYYKAEGKVKVEVPPTISETSIGKVIRNFEGKRCGYDFKQGFSMVERKDLHLFRTNYPYFIIHDEEGAK